MYYFLYLQNIIFSVKMYILIFVKDVINYFYINYKCRF